MERDSNHRAAVKKYGQTRRVSWARILTEQAEVCRHWLAVPSRVASVGLLWRQVVAGRGSCLLKRIQHISTTVCNFCNVW
jgi:hypothetical protein